MKSKSSIVLFSIVYYWLYLNVCLGYSLAKIFFNVFDEINKKNLTASLRIRKKFSFKNTIKIIIDFFLKFIKDWFVRIDEKFKLLIDGIKKVIKALKTCRRKFKYILKFKHNFRLFKKFLPIFWEFCQIFISFVKEIFFLNSIINWVIQWMNLIQLFMNKSLLITRIVYFLYLIILGILGVLIGFLLGAYKHEDEVNTLLLLFLLKILYNTRFENILIEYLHELSLEINAAGSFSKFSLKSIQQIDPRPSKITFKEPKQIPLPFSIIQDPIIFIDTEVLWDESPNYRFELFKFYRHVNQKI